MTLSINNFMKCVFLSSLILIQLLLIVKSYGQQSLTSEEVIAIWKEAQPIPNIDSVFRWDVQLQTRTTLDNMLENGIDTLVVFSVSYPGYGTPDRDSCITMYRVNSYFFWQHQGKYYFKKVHGQCEYKQSPADGEIISFSVKNYPKINDEFFMDSIHNVVKIGDRFRAKTRTVSHEPKYSIVLVLAEKYKYLNFTENDLVDRESMFFEYNQKLTSFKLFTLINNQTEKIE